MDTSTTGDAQSERTAESSDVIGDFQQCFETLCTHLLQDGSEPSVHASASELQRSSQVRLDVETSLKAFAHAAMRAEAYFATKRWQIASGTPDEALRNEIAELREELSRKNSLLQQNAMYLERWTTALQNSFDNPLGLLPAPSVAGNNVSQLSNASFTTSSVPQAGQYSSNFTNQGVPNASSNLSSGSASMNATQFRPAGAYLSHQGAMNVPTYTPR